MLSTNASSKNGTAERRTDPNAERLRNEVTPVGLRQVQELLSDLVRGQTEELGDCCRLDLVDRLLKPHPSPVENTRRVVLPQIREGPQDDLRQVYQAPRGLA